MIGLGFRSKRKMEKAAVMVDGWSIHQLLNTIEYAITEARETGRLELLLWMALTNPKAMSRILDYIHTLTPAPHIHPADENGAER